MSITKKWVGIIIGIVLLLSAGTGTGIYFLTSSGSPNATTESATLSTNLFNTNGTINPSAANELLTAVGYWNNTSNTAKYTAHNIAGRTSNNSGSTIIFPMGYVNGTSGDPLYWQATYLSGGYLSIWLSKCYTTSTWNASSVTVSYDTYATSTIQAYIDDTFYPLVTQSSSTLKSIFATPKTAGYQTLKSGTSNDTSYYYSSSYTSKFDNMSTTIGNGSYMWLPSFGEVFNNTTSSYTSNTTTYTGQWGLNSTDRAFATSLYADTSSTISYCWLRSGNSRADYRAMLVGSSGSAGSYDVNGSYGVRPAAHISLKSLADFAGYNISASVGSNCSVNYSNQIFYIVAATPITFTYTAKANYYINTLNIDSTTATITDSTTAPSSYTTLTNTQYKAYRSAYGVVTVILYNVSADISISATAAGNITLTNSNTSKISNANFTRATYDTITATITATYASGYYPQFKYNSNEYIKISASGGSGGIGAVAYDYTFSSNVLTLNFSGLPTGISNIPTITLNTHTLGSNNLVVNVSNAVYDIVYESTQTIVNVTPNSGYYITQAYVDSNIAEEIIYLDGTMVNTGNAFTIKYYTSQNSNKVKFILYDLEGSLTLNITLGNTKPELQMASGGAKIDGIAVMSTIGGSAEILGDNYEDLIVGDTITVVARLKLNGYQFDGWYINDELVSTDWSARLTYDEELVGSIVVARFSEISTNINTETDNNSELV